MHLHVAVLLTTVALSSLLGVVAQVHHRALALPPDAVYIVHNAYQCHGICVARTSCVSYNFDVRDRRCEVFDNTKGASLEFRRNSVYQDNVSNNGPRACDKRSCQQTEMCANIRTDKYQCLTVGCGEPAIVPDTEVSFASTAFGCVAEYTCVSGYYYDNQTVTSLCEDTGKWTDISINCTIINCGQPSTLPNTTVNFTTTEVNSVAVYTCLSENRTATSLCEASGKWTQPSINCTDACAEGACVSEPDCSQPGVTYLPGNTCDTFFQCNNGEAVPKDCGPGTIWDQNVLVCVTGSC